MSRTLSEQISASDWDTTPPAVQRVLLSFEREIHFIRERVARLEQAHEAMQEPNRERVARYHALVEQQFLHGLTPEQQQEMERLGREIDDANVSCYPSLTSLADTIAAHTGETPK